MSIILQIFYFSIFFLFSFYVLKKNRKTKKESGPSVSLHPLYRLFRTTYFQFFTILLLYVSVELINPSKGSRWADRTRLLEGNAG